MSCHGLRSLPQPSVLPPFGPKSSGPRARSLKLSQYSTLGSEQMDSSPPANPPDEEELLAAPPPPAALVVPELGPLLLVAPPLPADVVPEELPPLSPTEDAASSL